MTWLEAIIVAIVEGLTEYLPVSSTGHMIITQALLGLKSDEFLKLFTVNIQFGAILAVVVLYPRKFFSRNRLQFYLKLFTAFIPAAAVGLLFGKKIDALLESVQTVAWSLLIGGIVLLFVDRLFQRNLQEKTSFGQAFFIGLAQCIAMIPGVSRSAATIIGGMATGLNRKAAAEFSFFLAVPTMFAASVYQWLKNPIALGNHQIALLLLGNAVAFVVALLAIKWFIHYLVRYGFLVFGIYRIALGLILLELIRRDYPLDLI